MLDICCWFYGHFYYQNCRVFSTFQPNCLVVQCGGDGLNGDRIGKTNLTLETFEHCVRDILKCELPTLFLGGGMLIEVINCLQ